MSLVEFCFVPVFGLLELIRYPTFLSFWRWWDRIYIYQVLQVLLEI